MKIGDLIDVKCWKTQSFRMRFGVGMIIESRRGNHPIVGSQWTNWHTVLFSKNGVEKEFYEGDLAPLGYWI